MITMGQFDRPSLLKKHGISILTGEACGISARVLCDVTEQGKALLTDVLGVASLVPADAWNCEDGTIGSVMLPYEILNVLCVFALFADGAQIVCQTGDGLCGCQTDEDISHLEQAERDEIIQITRRYRRKGTGRNGMRNVHEMSGREV